VYNLSIDEIVQPSNGYWEAGEENGRAVLSGSVSRTCAMICDAAREIM